MSMSKSMSMSFALASRVAASRAARCSMSRAHARERMGFKRTTTHDVKAHVDESETIITSVENALVKRMTKLRESKKFRDDERAVVVASSTVMRECFSIRPGGRGQKKTIARILVLSENAKVPKEIEAMRIVRASERVLKKCAGVENADALDVVGEFERPLVMTSNAFEEKYARERKKVRVLALEGVQDPGNLGTLARTAVAFGWDVLALLPSTCDPFNDKAMRAARGATFRIDLVQFESFDELKKSCEALGMDMYAAEPNAATSADAESARDERRVCLVLGTEGRGLSDKALVGCKPVAVPMSGDMESLNVGIAGGVLMYLMRAR